MRAVRTKMTIPRSWRISARCSPPRPSEPGQAGARGRPRLLHEAGHTRWLPLRVTRPDIAAASFYGTWLVNDAEESPHLSLGRVKGELYIACAEHDELAPLPMVEELRGLFRRAGTAGEIELYPGVHHGFAFPQRWCYDKPAADRHWERLIALYRRRLGKAPICRVCPDDRR